MKNIMIVIKRPEDYEDVCHELVAEDLLQSKGEGWEYESCDEHDGDLSCQK